MAAYRQLRITGINTETEDSKTFFLEPVDGQALPYEAGQFLTFVFSKPGGEARRSYSMSSAPVLGEPLAITVKRVENGEFSRKLIDYAAVGDLLETTGAAGFFTLPDEDKHIASFFFFAAGSGITPILPLIKTILFTRPLARVVLIYSNRSLQSTIFYQTLSDLQARYRGQLVIDFLFSIDLHLERARLNKSLLAALLVRYSHHAPADTLYYTCGPFDYMRMVSITLLEEGVPLQHIRKEAFTFFPVLQKSVPPDTHRHRVEVRWKGKVYALSVQYPQTILSAAKEAGLAVPYSCEAGRCGSCAATCVEGKVWMSYNEVLMDEEMEKGRILTCTGYPIGGNVLLSIS